MEENVGKEADDTEIIGEEMKVWKRKGGEEEKIIMRKRTLVKE